MRILSTYYENEGKAREPERIESPLQQAAHSCTMASTMAAYNFQVVQTMGKCTCCARCFDYGTDTQMRTLLSYQQQSTVHVTMYSQPLGLHAANLVKI
eukprot:1982719-Amphidinium_carterae.1